jgi:hypothetical protein
MSSLDQGLADGCVCADNIPPTSAEATGIFYMPSQREPLFSVTKSGSSCHHIRQGKLLMAETILLAASTATNAGSSFGSIQIRLNPVIVTKKARTYVSGNPRYLLEREVRGTTRG